jgi:hypothetical protein
MCIPPPPPPQYGVEVFVSTEFSNCSICKMLVWIDCEDYYSLVKKTVYNGVSLFSKELLRSARMNTLYSFSF